MNAVIFGAGNIGRGLIGDVLDASGYSLTFIDADTSLVEMLSSEGAYRIVSADAERTVPIAAIVDARDEESAVEAIGAADVVATAVGGPVLKVIAPTLGAGLLANHRQHVNVIACENVHPNSAALRGYVAAACGDDSIAAAGFPNVVVDRIVPGAPGQLDVSVEAGFEFVVDRSDWVGELPEPTSIVFTDNLPAYKLRKLWLVNGLHAITAWLGIVSGHEYVHTAIADSALRPLVESAGSSAARALAAATDEFDEESLLEYCGEVLKRFDDSSLPDLAVRVARNPLDKLRQAERVMAPALAAEALGLDTTGFAAGIAAVFAIEDEAVVGLDKLKELTEETGIKGVLVDHCGVDPGGQLMIEIKNRTQSHREKGETNMVTQQVKIKNPSGLHARPAAQIVEKAQAAEAQVNIKKGDKTANAKSIMSVLALGANTGDTVTIEAQGDDAVATVAMLLEILESEEH